ncbi:membrane-spanning 4-domains subfamily A member 8-like [Mantella aurantiaca]
MIYSFHFTAVYTTHTMGGFKLCFVWAVEQELSGRHNNFIMSYPTSEGISTHCEPLMSSTPSAVQVPNVPLASSVQNINPPSLMNYALTSNMASSVPTTAPQWHVPTIMQPNMDRSSPFFQTFLKGKPLALGILVICASILEIAFGIAFFFFDGTVTSISGISFWGPVFYIIAGSLTIAAQKKPNVCLIRGSLSLNIISCIFSMIAVILSAVDMRIISYYYRNYYSNSYYIYFYTVGTFIILSMLLVINLLLFSVTISTSIFGCMSLSKVPTVIQVFVMQKDVTFSTNPMAIPAMNSQPPPPQYPVNAFGASPCYY